MVITNVSWRVMSQCDASHLRSSNLSAYSQATSPAHGCPEPENFWSPEVQDSLVWWHVAPPDCRALTPYQGYSLAFDDRHPGLQIASPQQQCLLLIHEACSGADPWPDCMLLATVSRQHSDSDPELPSSAQELCLYRFRVASLMCDPEEIANNFTAVCTASMCIMAVWIMSKMLAWLLEFTHPG